MRGVLKAFAIMALGVIGSITAVGQADAITIRDGGHMDFQIRDTSALNKRSKLFLVVAGWTGAERRALRLANGGVSPRFSLDISVGTSQGADDIASMSGVYRLNRTPREINTVGRAFRDSSLLPEIFVRVEVGGQIVEFTNFYFADNRQPTTRRDAVTPGTIPLPAGGVLLLTALAGVALARRRRS